MQISDQAQVYVLCIAYICESMNLYCLYPVTTFLLVDFKVINNVNNAGYYSGLFTAIYASAQTITCGYWGKLSDTIGKKNVIMIGLLTSMSSFLLLGFCENIYLLLIVRFIAGLLNANSAIIKSFVGKLSNDCNKGVNFGYITLSWSIGVILGSLIGGNIYGMLVTSYPILILCLTISIIYLICATMVYNIIPNYSTNIVIFTEIQNCKYDFPLIDILQYKHDKSVMSAIFLYVTVTIIDISVSEILPLWMVLSTTNGGIEYNSNNVSYVLSLTAFVGILSQPLYMLLEKCLHRISLFRMSLFLHCITIITIPYINFNLLQSSGIFIMLCVINITRYIFSCCIFNIVYTSISSSANAENIGHINGIAQSAGSICKVIFPLLIDPLFSLFAQNNNSYFNCHFVFNTLAMLHGIPLFVSFYLDKTKINIKNISTCHEKEICVSENA